MPSYGLSVALVEPHSLLGRDVRAVLKERAFPVGTLHLFHAGGKGEGILSEDEDEATFIAPLLPDSLETSRLAFLCGRPENIERFVASRSTEDDCLAIDLSGLRAGGPFVAPSEASADAPLPPGNLYLTYDATAAILADTVRVLDGIVHVAGVTAAIDRPASELGTEALDELLQQAISLASFKPLPKEVFDAQSAFNFYYPDDTGPFEERVGEDFTRLLGRSLPLTVLSARAGVFHGHHLRIEARVEGDAPSEEAVRAAFRERASQFEEVPADNRSGPVESAGRDETLLLRVASGGGSVRLALAADHLRRAGALMAVRLAEQVVRERGLLPDA